ncbi:MAG: hypothetical protein ACXVJB_06910 [Mucilaginibacter sp.]
MLAHFIQHKGKGGWVVALPMFISIILFIVADALSWTDKYIGAITLVSSGFILFMLDNKREEITHGEINIRTVKLPRKKRINTLMWIDVHYWAMLMSLVGFIWLLNLLFANYYE